MKVVNIALKIAQFAAITLGAFVVFKVASKASEAYQKGVKVLPEIIDAVNPASNKNVVYQAANSIVSTVTGNDTTVGSAIYDGVQKIKGALGIETDEQKINREPVYKVPAAILDPNQSSAETARLGRYSRIAQDAEDLSISNPTSRYTNTFDNMAM